jgi:hypothetical protein
VRRMGIRALGLLTIVRWLESDSDMVELDASPCSASEFSGVPELLIPAMLPVIIADQPHGLDWIREGYQCFYHWDTGASHSVLASTLPQEISCFQWSSNVSNTLP